MLGLISSIDSNYVECLDDRHNTSGYSVSFGDNLVLWMSSKHKIVSKSSDESKCRALAVVAFELI